MMVNDISKPEVRTIKPSTNLNKLRLCKVITIQLKIKMKGLKEE